MTDYLGQNMDVGDFCVIVEPYSKIFTIGRISGFSNKSVRCVYIPRWTEPEYMEAHFSRLCAPDFANTDIVISIDGIRRYLWKQTRDLDRIVKISPEMVKNFLNK